jgi:hypothetical protein
MARRKNRRKHASNAPAPAQPLVRRKPGVLVSSLIGLVSGVIGIVSYLTANVSVAPSTALDPATLFSTPFTVTNNGPLTLNDVRVSFAIGRVRNIYGGGISTYDTGGWVSKATDENSAVVQTEESGRPRTIPPQRAVTYSNALSNALTTQPLYDADMGVVVSYKVWYFPFRQEQLYRFKSERMTDGNLVWAPQVVESEVFIAADDAAQNLRAKPNSKTALAGL